MNALVNVYIMNKEWKEGEEFFLTSRTAGSHPSKKFALTLPFAMIVLSCPTVILLGEGQQNCLGILRESDDHIKQ
jgi:hypothetical protein